MLVSEGAELRDIRASMSGSHHQGSAIGCSERPNTGGGSPEQFDEENQPYTKRTCKDPVIDKSLIGLDYGHQFDVALYPSSIRC